VKESFCHLFRLSLRTSCTLPELQQRLFDMIIGLSADTAGSEIPQANVELSSLRNIPAISYLRVWQKTGISRLVGPLTADLRVAEGLQGPLSDGMTLVLERTVLEERLTRQHVLVLIAHWSPLEKKLGEMCEIALDSNMSIRELQKLLSQLTQQAQQQEEQPPPSSPVELKINPTPSVNSSSVTTTESRSLEIDSLNRIGEAKPDDSSKRIMMIPSERIQFVKGRSFHLKNPENRLPKLKWKEYTKDESKLDQIKVSELKLRSGDYLFYKDSALKEVKNPGSTGRGVTIGKSNSKMALPRRKERALKINY